MYSTTSVSAVSRQHLKVEAPALSCQASYESTAVVSLTMAAAAELYCCSWVVCGRQWQKCHVYISYGCYCYYLVDVRNRHYAALLSIHTYIHAYIHTYIDTYMYIHTRFETILSSEDIRTSYPK